MRLYIGKSYWWSYEFGKIKSKWNKVNGFSKGNRYLSIPERDFEKITGLKLAPGEIRKVKSITIELEER